MGGVNCHLLIKFCVYVTYILMLYTFVIIMCSVNCVEHLFDCVITNNTGLNMSEAVCEYCYNQFGHILSGWEDMRQSVCKGKEM